MKTEQQETHNNMQFDDIDLQIISELQLDGRITNVELARRVGISPPPCLRRVRRLEELGVIRGYHAVVCAAKLGWPISFFVLVGLESQKESVLHAFEKSMARWPEVRECHLIRGGEDFLLRIVARNAEHENELTRTLTEEPHVVRIRTLHTIHSELERIGVPL